MWLTRKQSKLITILGLLLLARYVYRLFGIIYEINVLEELNLGDRYGLNSWAVITNGCDDLGYEFAKQFALRNFNIVQLSDDRQMQAERAETLLKEFKIEVKPLHVDFSANTDVKYYEDIIAKPLKDLNVTIVVNNAGLIGSSLRKLTPKQVRDVTIVNTLPQVMMTKLFLGNFLKKAQEKNSILENEQMVARKVGGAFIDISSAVAYDPIHFESLYSATKAFGHYLTLGEAISNKGQVDYQSVLPFTIKGGATISEKMIPWATSTNEETVTGCLRALGQKLQTHGASRHIIIGEILRGFSETFPRGFMAYFISFFVQVFGLKV